MKTLCALDFETTGLDRGADEVIEVGLVLWSIPLHRPVRASGFLVKTSREISKEITDITGLTKDLLDLYGIGQEPALNIVLQWIAQADVLCAHNGRDFDRPFFAQWCKRHNRDVPQRVWIDTMRDLSIEGYRLGHMAADAGFLNPFPHMAVTDVLTMLRLLDSHGVETALQAAQTPEVALRAVVDFKSNQKAKDRKYRWDPERRIWHKTVKITQLEEEKKADFEVVVLEESVVK